LLYARSMRSMRAAAGVALSIVVACGTAWGQAPDSQAQHYKSVPLNLQKKQVGTDAMGDVGRARMRAGDCDGAVNAFDDALRSSTDPTLYRDRGLCHEKLGHPYPAIDDYRAYLTNASDAPDADDIRARLRRLEGAATGAPAAEESDPDVPEGLGAHATLTVGSGGAKASAGASTHDKASAGEADDEDDPLDTPLAKGKGWSLGPLLSFHKWFIGSSSLDGNPLYGGMLEGGQSSSEAFGADIRYSFGPRGSLVIEAAFEHFNATSDDAATANALTSQVGYEFRFPLSDTYRGEFCVTPGLGYEHLAVSPTDPQTAALSYGAFVPRVRLSYRLLLQPSVGLDFSADFGVANFFVYDKAPFDSASSATPLVALNLGILWGL